MTRKRYVKLLMACGFPRNDCQEAAQAVRVTECSYQDDMEDWLRAFRCRRVFKRTNEGLEELSRCVTILQQALGNLEDVKGVISDE